MKAMDAGSSPVLSEVRIETIVGNVPNGVG